MRIIPDKTVSNTPPLTIKTILDTSLQEYPDQVALAFFNGPTITYRELGLRVESLQNQLRAHGIRKGDRVGILGENSPNWGLAYLSVVTSGAVAVPILPDFPAEDIQHILHHAECRLLFATRHQLDKCSFENCRNIRKVIMLDDFSEGHPHLDITPLSVFIADALDRVTTIVQDIGEKTGLISQEIVSDDLAAIIYTSGTTGMSKGVMLSHGNIASNVQTTHTFLEIGPGDRMLSVLPMAHAYECTLGFLLPLSAGVSIYYLGRPPTPPLLKMACEAVRPTLMALVPLILEKVYKQRVKATLSKNILTRGLSHTPLVRRMIFRRAVAKIIDYLGGELKLVAFGGAPLNSEVEEFMLTGGFPFVVGYGLTEAAPLVTGERLKEVRRGAVGYPCPGVSVRIDSPDPDSGIGEIQVKGPNVMAGYYKNKRLTEETFTADGWLKTGDLGYLDDDRFLYIMGRSKNMFLGANGENIYPEVIEEKLNSILTVVESLVVENRDRIEAMVYIDPAFIGPQLEGRSQKEQQKIIKRVLEDIRKEANRKLPGFARIRCCHFEQEPFLKTATQKIKRYLYFHPGSSE